jgi:hypothetical protein
MISLILVIIRWDIESTNARTTLNVKMIKQNIIEDLNSHQKYDSKHIF